MGLFGKDPDFSDADVLILSKPDCGLCDHALEAVQQVRARYPFRLHVVKITPGDQWHDAYWDKIPVGFVNGHRAFMYRTTPPEFLESLRTFGNRAKII